MTETLMNSMMMKMMSMEVGVPESWDISNRNFPTFRMTFSQLKKKNQEMMAMKFRSEYDYENLLFTITRIS